MPPELFTIQRDGPGQLSTMAAPRGGDRLADEMANLAGSGVGVLVSHLTDAEMAELQLTNEAEFAQAAGLVFYRLPTPDREIPDPLASRQLAGKTPLASEQRRRR